MYSISEGTLKAILKKKFSSLVGNCMQEIDEFQKKYNLNETEIVYFKKLIKKLNYESMRDIAILIESFSNGVEINVNLKPTISNEE